MHPDVAKLVEAGRIHKSFGAGKVVDWDLPAKRVVIDFVKSAGQTMELQFAIQKTEWIANDDFRARKIEQLEELRTLSKSDPVNMVIHLLESHGGSMTGDALEKELCGTVIPEANFKKWWDTTKKALRESRKAVVPQKRTEAIVLRSGDRSPAQAMVADFEAARDIKGMIKALEAIAADIGAFDSDSEALKRLLGDIDEGAKKAARVQLGLALQLVAARNEVIGSSKTLELDPVAVRLSDLLQSADLTKIPDEAGALPSARQRAVYEAFPDAFGDEWVEKMVRVFDRVGARGVTEIARILLERGEMPALVNDVGASILNLLENDHLADGPRKTSRLQSLLGDDKTLLTDLVEIMDVNEARNFARRLLDCPVFGDLEKKSLMARIIKARPETGDSWESLEKKKAELDELVRVRIPQNTKDISIARSYGDLRENFEYKSAKDLQRYLGHRKNELEKDIARARGTDFKGSDASKVNIGTIVTLIDSSGAEVEMTVLGAWDSDPEKKLVSYLSEVGKALVGREPGESVQVRDETSETMQTLTIKAIRPFNP
ncbi:MAG: GreA/GreB family elongation factor [Akkermansiaceae bacterium]|nr:GreA/GreB family elongation factor [Akkermansiaceae bacterium]